MSRAFTFAELPDAHQLMHDNKHSHGNMAVLVGATQFGTEASDESPMVRELRPVPAFRNRRPAPPKYPWAASLPEVILQLDRKKSIVEDDGDAVRELMSASIVSSSPNDVVHTAATLMAAHRVNAVVLMKNAEGVGVVSQTDVVLAW